MKTKSLASYLILEMIFLLGLTFCPKNAFSTPINSFVPKSALNLKISPIKNIDAIVCINLDRRKDKWKRMQRIFGCNQVPISRFSGIDGWKNLDCYKFQGDCCFNEVKRSLNPGEKGCLLSHYSVWKKSLEKGLKTVWVLEDDVSIYRKPQLLSKVLDELERVDPKWDVLYTDTDFYRNFVNTPQSCRGKSILYPNFSLFKEKTEKRPYPTLHDPLWYTFTQKVSKNLKIIRGRFGLHSIIFSDRGLKKLVKHFEKTKFIFGADVEIYFAPGLRMYSTTSTIVGQNFQAHISDTSFGP